jgi:hypothetical protein
MKVIDILSFYLKAYMTYTLSEHLNVHLMASREELTKCLSIVLNKSVKILNICNYNKNSVRFRLTFSRTQKETAIDQQQRNCETLIRQRHQTILRLLSSAATASTRWRVREL